jgi:hypothetical protein
MLFNLNTVIFSFCKACEIKLLTTRPSSKSIRGPNVLNIRATLTSTFSYFLIKNRLFQQNHINK